MGTEGKGEKILATNRKAWQRFEVLETMEAGMALTGAEVKSCKTGQVSLAESHAIFKNNECWLLNCHVAAYPYATSSSGHEPTRTRRLLLNKTEIERWMGKIKAKGLTMVPLEIYANDKGRLKLKLALVKGKTGVDRRENIKKKDIEREWQRKYKIH
ncbi:MAG: SsrA-binding protein SmpB [Elusimicrobia bacterium]|nr:SsrA-binding protein SmpB [Elusimicrobiota bacterium]